MKITDVSAHMMGVAGCGGHSPSRNWIFVRVDTDEGVTGVGEATTEYHEHGVVAMIEQHFGPMLRGQDPTRIGFAWQQMQRGGWWRGGVVATSASSGIEQALWDITGRTYGQPVYRLLGGAVRDRVGLYARSDLGLSTHVEELRSAMAEGYRAFKCGITTGGGVWDPECQVKMAVALFRDLRGAAGSACDLMIDCGGILPLGSAVRLVRQLESKGVLFVEEPLNADSPEALAELRRACCVTRVAAGERQITRWGFRRWFDLRAVDVLQPDVCHCGGISELLRIAAWAEVQNMTVAPHNPYGPVALAASVHACAVMPNLLVLEHCRHRPWSDEVAKCGITVNDGCAELPDSPGLGVELDWDYIKKHPPVQLKSRLPRDRDGAIAIV